MPNCKIEEFKCLDCGQYVIRTGNRQLFCKECRRIRDNQRCRNYRARTFIPRGYNQKREKNNAWKNGSGWFTAWGKNFNNCNRCNSSKYLCVHHKDRNRKNNEFNNLEILCKKCHQIEHGILSNRDKFGRFIKSSC